MTNHTFNVNRQLLDTIEEKLHWANDPMNEYRINNNYIPKEYHFEREDLYSREITTTDLITFSAIAGLYTVYFETWFWVDFMHSCRWANDFTLMGPLGFFFCWAWMWYLTILEMIFSDYVDWDKYRLQWGYLAVVFLNGLRHSHFVSKIIFNFLFTPIKELFVALFSLFIYIFGSNISIYIKFLKIIAILYYIYVVQYYFQDYFIRELINFNKIFFGSLTPDWQTIVIFLFAFSPILLYLWFKFVVTIGDWISGYNDTDGIYDETFQENKIDLSPRSKFLWMFH